MTNNRSLRNKLLIGASLSAMLLSGVAEAQDRSGGGWGRGARGAGADPTAAAARAAQDEAIRQTQTNSSTQRALDAFRRAAQTRTQMQDAQMQARIAAQQAINNVPNGIGQGGLQAAPEIAIDPSLWVGANGPTQSAGKDGRTNVTVDQTESKAILTWDSFNVGTKTDLTFKQDSSDWVVLNRVRDASPSQIHGSVNAKGTVLILNQNGILFGGASTVNVRNLVASSANITNTTFLNDGIFSKSGSDENGFPLTFPAFTGAGGRITVEAGAQITTEAPGSAIAGGGYVLLMGTQVSNEGSIVTPRGQVALAAGDDFYVTPGYGTEVNRASTTRGNEVAVRVNAQSLSGDVINRGILEASEGDITLAGRRVVQDGVALVTTTVTQRGTIHLLTDASDADSHVILTGRSVTLALPDLDSKETATNAQRDALIAQSNDLSATGSGLNNQRFGMPDRKDLSRIEITTGGSVEFQSDSTTIATGGQIATSAGKRVSVSEGAVLDVSGAQGVSLAMASNQLMVNVQPFELRDSPLNRENKGLISNDVWVDVRDLVLVPDGTGGYEGDRWYTPDGLLEVGGYLANSKHGIGEWTAQGGTINIAASEIVAESGSTFNVGGGSLDYAAGYISTTRVLGADGKLYDVGGAPAGMKMVAWGDAFVRKHERWGEAYTQVWSHPLGGSRNARRWSAGYTVGRDAGALTLSAPNILFDGDLLADVITGERQVNARPEVPTGIDAQRLDGYDLGQTAAPLAGALYIGNMRWDGRSPQITALPFENQVIIGEGVTGGVDIGAPIGTEFVNKVLLSADALSKAGLGGLRVTGGTIAVEGDITLVPGGQVAFHGLDRVDVSSDITARSGAISITTGLFGSAFEKPATINIGKDVRLDTRGVWTNIALDPSNRQGLAHIAGGDIILRNRSGEIILDTGSVLDASAGGAILRDGSAIGATGGNVTIEGVTPENGQMPPGPSNIALDGAIRSYGSNGHAGGTLTLSAAQPVVLGESGLLAEDGVLGAGEAAPTDLRTTGAMTIKAGEILPDGSRAEVDTTFEPGTRISRGTVLSEAVTVEKPLSLTSGFFQTGFSNYVVAGSDVVVQPGAQIDVLAPQQRITAASTNMATGSDPDAAMELWQPPVFQEDQVKGEFIQRAGASLTLKANSLTFKSQYEPTGGVITMGRDSRITVDDGQSINLVATTRMAIEGKLEAHAGAITLSTMLADHESANAIYYDPGNAIWLGDGAFLDVSGQARIAIDKLGRRYGEASAGGSVTIGHGADRGLGLTPRDGVGAAYVVMRPGSVIDASGVSIEVDGLNGRPVLLAGDGGSIAFASQYGIVLDGAMNAASGGATASGGTLSISLSTPKLFPTPSAKAMPDYMRRLRTVVIDQNHEALLPNDAVFGECFAGCWTPGVTDQEANAGKPDLVGQARIGVDQILAGGFDSLNLKTDDVVLLNGPISMQLGRSLTIAGNIALIDPDADAHLSAAYVNLDGAKKLPGRSLVGGDLLAEVRGDAAMTGRGRLTIEAAFMDLGEVAFGAGGSVATSTGEIPFAYVAPGELSLVSHGDIRFTGGTTQSVGDISLTAAQIYPATGVKAELVAGQEIKTLINDSGFELTALQIRPGSRISIHGIEGATPAAPLSLYGTLSLAADIIEQGGVLRAPLGSINLGRSDQTYALEDGNFINIVLSTSSIDLLDGSITSVSARDLVIPYGGTRDDLAWDFQGLATPSSAPTGVTIIGALTADEGSTLDLSGGGTVAGAGFISGRGGSVDVLRNPLANANPAYAGISNADNQVFAIVPTYAGAQAPIAQTGTDQPGIGRQVIIPEGVKGLPAGTYMLLPAEYALLPGAFRIEIGDAGRAGRSGAAPMPDGSFNALVTLGVANTSIRDSLPREAIISSADVVRSYAQYHETDYSKFLRNLPSTTKFDQPVGFLPEDGKVLTIQLPMNADTSVNAFSFHGTGLFDPAKGGRKGGLAVTGTGFEPTKIEILGRDGVATDGWRWLYADDLNAVGAGYVVIGGTMTPNLLNPAGPTLELKTDYSSSGTAALAIRSGAELKAPQLVLMVGEGQLDVDSGARLTTIGMGPAAYDSTMGYRFDVSTGFGVNPSVIMLANGLVEIEAPKETNSATINIANGASLLSEGTLAFRTPGSLSLGNEAQFGARYMGLSSTALNIGDTVALEDAAGRGLLPEGLLLNQAALDRLMAGNPAAGAPALERLMLTASQSLNIFGSVSLDTGSTASEGGMQLVFSTPAIYGHGEAGDVATLAASTIVWNGTAGGKPAGIIADGAGTGSGTLNLVADRIVLGFQDDVRPDNEQSYARTAVGFGTVNLVASERIVSNNKGSLSVYASRADYGQPGTGGRLNLVAPLLTGEAGSLLSYTAGDAITLTRPEGAALADTAKVKDLGAEIRMQAATIDIDSAVALPSGKLMLTAQDGIRLGADSRIDLSGRATTIVDETRYSWGGDLIAESLNGDFTQVAGGTIDLTASYNHAGLLQVTATNGTVSLEGTLSGAATAKDGNTDPDLRGGSIDIRANTIADLVALNGRLNSAGFTESRSFAVKSGDLIIGDELVARRVSVSADGGSLTVHGRIHASGAKPGTIRLSARDELVIASGAVLDVHSTALQVDSYGAPIEASNRGQIELTSAQGMVELVNGATLDLRSADAIARGRIDINVPRLGANDAAILASGALTINGADRIVVNAFRSYTPDQGIITQALLADIHDDSTAYINAALDNGGLMNGKLAGLRRYSDAFHFRPGVELRSVDGGDLSVSGDLNLADFRYRSVNAATPLTTAYGSGEAGSLIIRAANDLDIYGSITDGFEKPAATPDDTGWLLFSGNQGTSSNRIPTPTDFKLPRDVSLEAGTRLIHAGSLTFDAPIGQATILAGEIIPAEVVSATSVTIGSTWTATAAISLPDGSTIAAGTVIARGTVLPAGTRFATNTRLPVQIAIAPMTWPKGASIEIFGTGVTQGVLLAQTTSLRAGDIIPAASTLQLAGGATEIDLRPDGGGSIWAAAAMLPKGSESWSMRLVAGADLDAADTRSLLPASVLAARGKSGNLTLSDRHFGRSVEGTPPIWDPDGPYGYLCSYYPSYCEAGAEERIVPSFSVLRTGIGSLDLLAGGSFSESSLFGVYTAGTPSDQVGGTTSDGHNVFEQPRSTRSNSSGDIGIVPGVAGTPFADAIADYRAWYPEHGGDVLLSAQDKVSGYTVNAVPGSFRQNSADVGNWLWRQGSYGLDGYEDIPTAWWINFGTYGLYSPPTSQSDQHIAVLRGFTGIGTLGGGNLSVRAGADAGVVNDWGLGSTTYATQGLTLAIGATGRVTGVEQTEGRVTGGTLVQTGGGELDVRIGGSLNPAFNEGVASNGVPSGLFRNSDLGGTFTNLRGNIEVMAGNIGKVLEVYVDPQLSILSPKLLPVNEVLGGTAVGGVVLVPGDGSVKLNSRGDLVLAGAADPGRVNQTDSVGLIQRGSDGLISRPANMPNLANFTLWHDDTAISLMSAGSDIVLATFTGSGRILQTGGNDAAGDYPAILSAVTPGGDVYWGPTQTKYLNSGGFSPIGLITLAPSPIGRIEVLAGGSIIASGSMQSDLIRNVAFGMPITLSGAASDPNSIANPFKPGGSSQAIFRPAGSLGELYEGTRPASLFYAAGGDIRGLNFGYKTGVELDQVSYISAGAVRVRAERDIVNFGSSPQLDCFFNGACPMGVPTGEVGLGGVIVHNAPTDISLISAGRDIIYANVDIAGPGNLIVEAGRNIYQEGRGRFTSVGPQFNITPETRNGGASITVLTGVGAGGPNYDALASLYLNPENLAESGRPLVDQPGKVAKTYEGELKQWLKQRFGFETTDTDDALAYFEALPAEQRAIFTRKVYFDELNASGREYTGKTESGRLGSYLRGRNAIDTLFPGKDKDGKEISYAGDYTMTGGSGVRTLFGGDIEILVAGGQTLIGMGDVAPPSTAGVLSMGSGDIDVYSLGSVLLSKSRMFTTFGGAITVWSAEGDINAGRGSNTTAVFQPPRRVYDGYGNVTLSPPTQNTGAGIATLNPLPEITPGDIDLVAPLGTIDAGEAGVRVSGNINLAALQVLNAANIQVQGEATGIPAVAAVNTGALTSASSATTAVANQAAELAERARPQVRTEVPVIVQVRLLGFGENP